MIDLLILWAWEHDVDFLSLLVAACEAHHIHPSLIGPRELPGLRDDLLTERLKPRMIIDRVWDWGGEFARHCDVVQQKHLALLNDYDLVRRAWNKPTMHYELIAHGLSAPYMIVLPSYEAQPGLTRMDLQPLGERFSVKGAHSGGSGVLHPACTWDEIMRLRTAWPKDETILQTWVNPLMMGKHRAWFRVFYACGACFPCWADDLTHDQNLVSAAEESMYHLDVLRGMTQQIAGLCSLNVFSTEIALNQNHVWQIVDYVNEPCDYRLKTKAPNGVPDEVVIAVAARIASWVRRSFQ
jgi:hypothetical protein